MVWVRIRWEIEMLRETHRVVKGIRNGNGQEICFRTAEDKKRHQNTGNGFQETNNPHQEFVRLAVHAVNSERDKSLCEVKNFRDIPVGNMSFLLTWGSI